MPPLPELRWLPEQGYGTLLDVPDVAYDGAYFAKYQRYAQTPLGAELTLARLNLVQRHWSGAGTLLDIGSGAGQFVQACRDRHIVAHGRDVCPPAKAWLRDHGWEWPGEHLTPTAITFWDSLEHLRDPGAALDITARWAFVALPVHDTRAEWVRSKHFRPGEHLWYWSTAGFERWAKRKGFATRARSTIETDLGREHIVSFVLERA